MKDKIMYLIIGILVKISVKLCKAYKPTLTIINNNIKTHILIVFLAISLEADSNIIDWGLFTLKFWKLIIELLLLLFCSLEFFSKLFVIVFLIIISSILLSISVLFTIKFVIGTHNTNEIIKYKNFSTAIINFFPYKKFSPRISED